MDTRRLGEGSSSLKLPLEPVDVPALAAGDIDQEIDQLLESLQSPLNVPIVQAAVT